MNSDNIFYLFLGIVVILVILFFRKKTIYTKRDIKTVGKCAQRLVDVINESKDIANNSIDPFTKVSRLNVAKDKLKELKELKRKFYFIKLYELNEIEFEINEIEHDIQIKGYKSIAEANETGQQLEKSGLVDEAIKKYEEVISKAVDTPFPYRRLAILYSKNKMVNDEIRVLKEAMKNIPVSNKTHFEWFEKRYKKRILNNN